MTRTERGRVKFGVVPASALTAADVEAMWDLRARVFQLKSTPSLDTQREGFVRRVRMGQRTLLGFDKTGVLRAMFSIHWRPSIDGRQLWLLPEYGFAERGFRGGPNIAGVLLREMLNVLWVARGRPVWFAAICYPRSFQMLSRSLGHAWTLADAAAPPEAHAVLRYHHETFAGDNWDRATHRVRLPTLPEPAPPLGTPLSEEWRRCEALVPDWAQGFGLGMAVHIRIRTLFRLMWDGWNRSRKVRAP